MPAVLRAVPCLLLLAVPAAATPPSPRPSLPPGAQAMSGTFHPGAAVQRAVEAWNAADLGYFESAFDEDVTVVGPAGRPVRGRAAALDALAAPLDERLQVEATGVVTGTRGDAAWASWRWTGERGAELARSGTAAALFVRQDGVWRIVLVHLTLDGSQP